MTEFLEIYKKVDGTKRVRQFWYAHVLTYALLMVALLGISKKSLEIVRLAVNNRLLKKLRRKYRKFIKEYCNYTNEKVAKPQTGQHDKIWICWFQGIDNAPSVVKSCYESIKLHIRNREIIVVTLENYREYVQFPENIHRKMETGVISLTQMSDLLRLELLSRYGGTWMDATVFCTGECPAYMLDADLFVFQNLKPGLDGSATCISNWFITAKPDNPIIKLTLALLYEYWNKHDKLIDYFIFHYFFQLAIEAYPEEWNVVVPFSNAPPHILLLKLFESFDERVWKAVKEQTPFHKLSYKLDKRQTENKGTYYSEFIRP